MRSCMHACTKEAWPKLSTTFVVIDMILVKSMFFRRPFSEVDSLAFLFCELFACSPANSQSVHVKQGESCVRTICRENACVQNSCMHCTE